MRRRADIITEKYTYSVYDDGEIIRRPRIGYHDHSTKTLRIQTTKKKGIHYVRLDLGEGRRYYAVGRLVAKYFVPGEDKEHMYVCYKDGDYDNNNADNLFWATYKELVNHRAKFKKN